MPVCGSLFPCEDPVVWRRVYNKYWDVVALKSIGKGKKPGNLLPLDKWYQEELPIAVASRAERFLTHSELVKVMEWKLARGKFRPRLRQLVSSNSSEAVEGCTRKAFTLLPDIQAAVKELSSLKAIGPATASAVLAAGAPELAAFMADEAVESVPCLKPIQYTAKHYSVYLQKVVERARSLNKADDVWDWTPHRVELCLWAWVVARELQPSLLQGLDKEQSVEESLEESVENGGRPAKRQKTK